MITPEDEKYISSRAYIPEHVLNLMLPLSKGEPFLIDGYVYFLKNDNILMIGYPLEYDFTAEKFEAVLKEVIKKTRPRHVWLIAPEIPAVLSPFCKGRESDYYYKLELGGFGVKKGLLRLIGKASADLNVERGKMISEGHKELISEFMKREKPKPYIRELFITMEDYVEKSATSIVLSAYSKKGKLTAFYVLELGASDFVVYLIGCHSKKNCVPHASDLLFLEMITLAKEQGKGYVHLGLGVNEGIRKFKEKWGGVRFLPYEFCEYSPPNVKTRMFDMMMMEKRL